jgi:hypothetical protein
MNIMNYVKKKVANRSNRANAGAAVDAINPTSLTEKQLKEFNWTTFGKSLLQNNLLPPTYMAEPQSVSVYTGLDRLPRVELTFGSGTIKQTKTLVIDKSEVMVADDKQIYVDSQAMSKVWQDLSGVRPDKDMIGPVM